MSGARVMLWVQHLLGIGHQRRAAVIARQLCRRGARVCYVSGGYPLPSLDVGEAELIQLPPARTADATFDTLIDEQGEPVSPAWQRARRDTLLKVFDDFRPDVLLTESYPFGRGLLRFELEPLVERAHRRRPRPRLVSSVRDILQPRSDKRNQAIAELVRSRYDLVLVHSDPRVVELSVSFPVAEAIRDQTRYTGYVTEDGLVASAAGEGSGVLISGGGGVVAERLLQAALGAHPLSRLNGEPWRVLAGPAVGDAAFERLRGLAHGGARVERNRADFAALLADCRVSVSQGGYNTLMDVVSARARALIVPFSDAGQAEQPTRARLFAARGLVQVLPAEALEPSALAAAIDRTADARRPPAGALDLDGAGRAAEWVLRLAAGENGG